MNARAALLCMAVVASLTLTAAGLGACGRSRTGTPVASPSVSAAAADRQAAQMYFASLEPIVERDYQIQARLNAAGAAFDTATDPFDRQIWERFAQALSDTLPDAQRVLAGYQSVKPPAAFAAAHALLVQINQMSLKAARGVIANMKSMKPIKDWALQAMAEGNAQSAPADRMLAEFRSAAARVGLQPPARLLAIYSDQSATPSANSQPSV